MKKLILLTVITILTIGCEPAPIDYNIGNTNLIWIDVRENPPRILFSDLANADDGWQKIGTVDDIPGFEMELTTSKDPKGGTNVWIRSDQPVSMVKFATTILHDKNQRSLDIESGHEFSAKVDSVGSFRVIFKND